MRFLLALTLSLMLALSAAAQYPLSADPCEAGGTRVAFRGADVSTSLTTTGQLLGKDYVVPVSAVNPSMIPSFGTALWLGGTVGGEMRLNAGRYTDYRFHPGQTGPDHVPPDPSECAAADRIWSVARSDVEAYVAGGTPTRDLLDWPVHLGAPVLDGDGIAGNYDLEAGDQPAIQGDVTAFWAMTDTAADTSFAGFLPVGVDVAVEAFAFRELRFGRHTFFRFTITNRNDVPIDSAYIGLFSDINLGGRSDNYVATDTTLQLVYAYNGDEEDDVYGIPPAFGYAVLQGPTGLPNGRDDDGDGIADEPGERVGITSTTYITNSGPFATTDPFAPMSSFNRLRGRWNDGSPIRAFGDGYDVPAGQPSTSWIYPGDPVADSFWSEENIDGAGTANGASRRTITLGSGPFTLLPDSSTTFVLAVLFAQGADRMSSVRTLRGQARGVLAAQASGAFEPLRVDGPIRQRPLAISRPRPNPFSDAAEIQIQGAADTPVRVSVYDVLGRRLSTTETTAPEARVEVGRELASGVYVVRVEGRGFAETFTIAKTR